MKRIICFERKHKQSRKLKKSLAKFLKNKQRKKDTLLLVDIINVKLASSESPRHLLLAEI